ncbi:hypothetical protein [Nonomuraea sp. LPB2021202275-12-8]|uniref:hypothetical protein n=1 Tax=Nonomuraea sp. LPB2021202275-12-8 TaxID=3120159 RepID=UPI00300D0B9D
MANRVAANYTSSGGLTTHEISFTAPAAGSRLIVAIICPGEIEPGGLYLPADTSRNFVLDAAVNAFYTVGGGTATIFSIISNGTETLLHVEPSFIDNADVLVWERDDCPAVLSSDTVEDDTTSLAMGVEIPDHGPGGLLVAVAHSNTNVSGNLTLGGMPTLTNYRNGVGVTGKRNVSSATPPAAGEYTWSVSGFPPPPFGGDAGLAVVTYGSPPGAAAVSRPTISLPRAAAQRASVW